VVVKSYEELISAARQISEVRLKKVPVDLFDDLLNTLILYRRHLETLTAIEEQIDGSKRYASIEDIHKIRGELGWPSY